MNCYFLENLNNLKQLRIAEMFRKNMLMSPIFFNGGIEETFEGEDQEY